MRFAPTNICVYTTWEAWINRINKLNRLRMIVIDPNVCWNFTTSDSSLLTLFLGNFRGFMSSEQFRVVKKLISCVFEKFLRYFLCAASSSILRWWSLKLFIENKYLKRNCLSSQRLVDWWQLLGSEQVPHELESSPDEHHWSTSPRFYFEHLRFTIVNRWG